MKAWEGRFTKGTSSLMEKFSASIHFDWVLYRYDIEGSIAYAEMLRRIKILSEDEEGKIVTGLREIEQEIGEGRLPFQDALEDIHMHVEARLIEKVGDLGKKLHTGRSRNDQVTLDMRLLLKEQIPWIDGKTSTLMRNIVKKAEEEKRSIVPGYTHTRRAQAVPFAHHLLAYYYMLKRDRQRLSETLSRLDVLPLGSGALAGSTIPIDREFLAKRLGFAKISENSMDTVSDRDFVLDTLFSLSMIMTHLSRFAEDLILFSSEEFSFLDLPDEVCTGSSLMPHKKNPDSLELIRGKTARTVACLFSLFTLVKGLPLTYNRDFQEDKEPLFQGLVTTADCLDVMSLVISGLKVNREAMQKAVKESFTSAVEMAEYLVAKGTPFREAHFTVGKMVKGCEEKKKYLWQMSLEEMKAFDDRFEGDVFSYSDPHRVLSSRKTAGGASFEEVDRQIEKEKAYLYS
jgi:argininosuccinate lyase